MKKFLKNLSFRNDFNTLTANYEITRRLPSLLGHKTTSYLVLSNLKKIKLSFFSELAENYCVSKRIKLYVSRRSYMYKIIIHNISGVTNQVVNLTKML